MHCFIEETFWPMQLKPPEPPGTQLSLSKMDIFLKWTASKILGNPKCEKNISPKCFDNPVVVLCSTVRHKKAIALPYHAVLRKMCSFYVGPAGCHRAKKCYSWDGHILVLQKDFAEKDFSVSEIANRSGVTFTSLDLH